MIRILFFFLVTDPISMLGSHNLNNQATLVYNQNKTPSTKWINPVYTNNSYVHKLEPRTHTEEYDSTGNYSYTSIAPFLIKKKQKRDMCSNFQKTLLSNTLVVCRRNVNCNQTVIIKFSL